MSTFQLEQTGQQVQDILNEAPQTKLDLQSEIERATGKENELAQAIADEKTRAEGIEGGLRTDLDAEIQRATDKDVVLENAIGAEETRAEGVEGGLRDDVDAIDAVIPNQASSSNQLADKAFVNSSIATNTADFKGTYNSLEQLETEVTDANANDYAFVIGTDQTGNTVYNRYKYVEGTGWVFEYALNNSSFTASQWAAINSAITAALVAKLIGLPTAEALTTSLNDLLAAIGAEKTRAELIEAGLRTDVNANAGAIVTEKNRAEGVEGTLTNGLSGEILNRSNADTALGLRIDGEATLRENADSALQGDIDDINDLIPTQASENNQLADKEFVNSSIATNTAEFKGTYYSLETLEESVTDANANDYAFVISTDEAGNTVYNRYKYVEGTGWVFEYALNNSSFTASQWAAINSEITAALVAKLAGLPNADALAAAFAAITAKIPTEASAENQLADKAFVSDQVAASYAELVAMVVANTLIPDEVDLTVVSGKLTLKDNIYNPLLPTGMGRVYLKRNPTLSTEYYLFDGFVEGVDLLASLTGTPELIFWDRVAERFVGKSGGYYYAAWVADDNYVPTRQDCHYVYNDVPYLWDGSTFAVDDEAMPDMVNTLSQSDFPYTNTIYIIRDDFTLAENITIPANCVLQFDGGSISGEHTITGDNTGIQAGLVKIFSTDVTLDGTFVIKSVNAHLFGAKADGVADDTLAIQKAELLAHCVPEKRPAINGIKQYANKFELINGVYKVSSTIFIGSNISFNGNGSMLKPVSNGNFDNDYIIKVKEQTQVGDFYKIVWENIAIFNEDTNTSLNGIYFGGQGYIKRISTINIDRAIYIEDAYKDFIEIDGVYCLDGSPDVYKIHGGYMGDARVFKNISTGGSATKALEVGSAHMSCTVENLIHGALLIERSATLVKSCMFNNDANSIVTIKGACVDFVNCFFGFFGKEKVFIDGDVYGWMKPNVNFENCIFGYTPEYYVPKEEFVDNPISISNNGAKVNFVNTFFGEKYRHAFYSTFAPHINDYDSLNIYFEDGIKNTSSIVSFSKEVEGLYISGVNCSVSGQAPNLLGTAGTWNYGLRLIVDAKRQLIAGSITAAPVERSLEVTENDGVIITNISTSKNKNAILYIEKEINGSYQHVLIPLRNNPPVLLDNGITIGGRKWNDGTIDLSYATNVFRVDFMSVKANSDTFNVKVYAPLLTLAQINNRIINNNSANWLKGDTLICAEGEFTKNANGDWYNNAGVKLGTKACGAKSERPVGSAIHVGFQYLQVDTTYGTFPIWASAISGDTVTWVKADGSSPDA